MKAGLMALLSAIDAPTAPTVHLWPPAARVPLPAPPAWPLVDEFGNPIPLHSTLPFTPPSAPSVDFYRGQFCGTRVPGLPLRPGMAGFTEPGWRENAALNPPIMALDLFRYRDSKELQNRFLEKYASDGNTHLQMSIGHALMCGWTIDEYIELAARVQEYVPFRDHWFLGGAWSDDGNEGGGPWNKDRDAAYWKPLCDPWIDALVSNHVIDAACVGWQLDGFNAIGRPIISIIDYVADRLRPHGIPIGTHWRNEAGGWWDPSDGLSMKDRFGWWQYFVGKLRWFHHQGDTTLARTKLPEYQRNLAYTMDGFGNGQMGPPGTFALVVYECTAQDAFDLRCSEDEQDLVGFYLCCSRSAHAVVGGYGNGARRPDGSVL